MTAGTIDTTPDMAGWPARGLLTLFGFAVATLLGAVVTFVAHNWAYLSTGGKLGGIAALLIIAAGLWIWRRFDGPAAVSFGIAAQVLIGVWLAAAGQIFQAPGGLQDLALNWAMLGLPFALASRSWAHWAVWLAVVALAAASPVGLMLADWLPDRQPDWSDAIGGSAMGVALLIGLYRRAPDWFTTLAAAASVSFWTAFGITAVFSGLFGEASMRMIEAVLAIAVMAGLGHLSLRSRRRAASALLAAGSLLVLTWIILRPIWETVNEPTAALLLSTLVVGGATFVLVKLFQRIVAHGPEGSADAMDDASGTPWYMDAFIAFGGFMTAMLGVFLLGSVIGLISLLTQSIESALIVSGVVIYALSVFLRRKDPGQFLRFLLDTMILVGIAAMVGGVGILLGEEQLAGAGLLTLGLAALTAWLVPRDRILHVVLTLGAIGGVLAILSGMDVPGDAAALLALMIFALAGIAFGTETLGGQRRLTVAVVFLLAAILAGMAHDVSASAAEWAVLPRAVDALLLVGGMAWMAARLGRDRLPSLLVLGTLALIAIILPLGAGPSLLLLLLGYALRSRALFAIGVAAMAYYLFAAYYDLSLTLMQLSGMMALTGSGLLALWWVASRRVEATL